MRRRLFLQALLGLCACATGRSLGPGRGVAGAPAGGQRAAAGDGQDAGRAGAGPAPSTAGSAQDPAGAGRSGPSAGAGPASGAGELPRRALGSTGVSVPALALGGFHLGQHTEEAQAVRLVRAALDEGLRFFDTAEQYQRGDDSRSERWLGIALEPVRDEVFLMTKTYAPDTRSAASARAHLEDSLRRLRTDHLDLWQLHSIQDAADVDRAFAGGGAMDAILAARDEGVVRFAGVTGHTSPAAHLRALEHWDAGRRYDVVQLPINPIDRHQLSFQREVLPELRRRGIGVLAMKTAAGGALVEQGLCSPDECLRYVLGLDVDVLVSGMETPEQVRANAAAVRAGPLGPEEAGALLARIRPRADLALEWYKRA